MIRPARPEDAAAIAAIWNPVIRDTTITFTTVEKTESALRATIAERAAFLVWMQGGVLGGFATFGPFRTGPGYALIQEHTIIMAPASRGRGAGRALMTALEARGRDLGMQALIGGVSGSNADGIAFHARLGYAEVGRVPRAGWKLGAWHDLVLMHKFL